MEDPTAALFRRVLGEEPPWSEKINFDLTGAGWTFTSDSPGLAPTTFSARLCSRL